MGQPGSISDAGTSRNSATLSTSTSVMITAACSLLIASETRAESEMVSDLFASADPAAELVTTMGPKRMVLKKLGCASPWVAMMSPVPSPVATWAGGYGKGRRPRPVHQALEERVGGRLSDPQRLLPPEVASCSLLDSSRCLEPAEYYPWLKIIAFQKNEIEYVGEMNRQRLRFVAEIMKIFAKSKLKFLDYTIQKLITRIASGSN